MTLVRFARATFFGIRAAGATGGDAKRGLQRRIALWASALLLATMGCLGSAPQALALPCVKAPPPGPIVNPFFPVPSPFSVTCNNSADRADPVAVIWLTTIGNGSFIELNNSGNIATLGIGALAIETGTLSANSDITIINSGNVATLAFGGIGINANTVGADSDISISNSGNLATDGLGGIGINAITLGANSAIIVQNSGNLATIGLGGIGINADTASDDSGIVIQNSGNIATLDLGGIGLNAETSGFDSDITINNSGNIATLAMGAIGINGITGGFGSDISIQNSGNLATEGSDAIAILATSNAFLGDVDVLNRGNLTTEGEEAFGIFASLGVNDNDVTVENSARIRTRGDVAHGIVALTAGINHDVEIANSGEILTFGREADGVSVAVDSATNVIIRNSGSIFTRGDESYGIDAVAIGTQSPLTIINSGDIEAQADEAIGIAVGAFGPSSPVRIENSGSVTAGFAGILAAGETVSIVNTGTITADSLFAIGAFAAEADVFNSGTITGFVELFGFTEFVNRNGGVFEAREVSDFGGLGLFRNQSGGTVHTAAHPGVAETTVFIGLDQFQNHGLISLVDGAVGDVFELTNCGCSLLSYSGSGNAALGVDAFLGPPGSTADNFIIDGNTSGKTALLVNNTNPGGGSYNTKGIPIVFANGNVKPDAFYLKKPVDAGLFDYDLIFRPTGSGVFELKSFPGGGSHSLPHIITTSQDLLHTSSETWLDRSADLRVLLNTKSHDTAPLAAGAQPNDVTPAVWVRGAGTWLNQDDKATTNAYGRTYRRSLDRNLETTNFQTGVDLGKRDVLSQGDMVVFGPLAGVVLGSLDYDDLARQFNFSAAEVGGYATYLKGGLFVDTQAKVHFMEVDPKDVRGLPNTFGATNYGLRTDTGYRFGSFNGGMFIEPLATLAVTWTNIDTLAIDGNTVRFNDEVNVRGRLGVRVGTSYAVWSGTTMEPFVIGSLWSNLSDDNDATVVSNNTTFKFTDKPEDVWSVLSAGVNFFNPGAQTTVFAKLDVTVAEDTDGISAKAGMRYNW